MEIKEDVSDRGFDCPDEILLEILVRLPPKSIFRFRCVSKNWLFLISHPSFFPCYVARSKASPPFMLIFQYSNCSGMHCLVSNGKTFECLSPPFPSDHIPGLKVEATSNDLILHQSTCQEYFVSNPFTRQCVTLPMHSTRTSCGSAGLISHVRNAITSYNVARLIKDCDSNILNLETFSSQKGEWMNFQVTKCAPNVELDARPCVAFNGALHWICNRMTALLAYDPFSNPHECRLISIPNEAYNMNGMNAILGVSCGNVYYFEMNRICIQESKFPGWKLWVLKDYERGEWSLDEERKDSEIESMGVLCSVLLSYSPLLPLAFHPWDKDIVYFWYEGYVLTFSVKKGWFGDELFCFSSERMVSTWETFPLLMPLCPTQLPHMPN